MIINGNGLAIVRALQRSSNEWHVATERLSSGKRINRAADDASGLAISEKVRALLIGSNQAVRNIQDGRSLLATADAAMMEISDVVQRMRELTIQAMNATVTDVSAGAFADVHHIQNEIDALKGTLREIVQQTEFNTAPLLTSPLKETTEVLPQTTTARLPVRTTKATTPLLLENERGTGKVSLPTEKHPVQGIKSRPLTTPSTPAAVEKQTTVNDHTPRYSTDGKRMLFQSTRDPSARYETALTSELVVTRSTASDEAPVRLSYGGFTFDSSRGALKKETTDSEGTKRVTYVDLPNYGYQNGPNGMTFAPRAHSDGTIDLLFTTSEGNIRQETFDPKTKRLLSSRGKDVIPVADTLDLPPKQSYLALKGPPELYEMNTPQASLQVKKHTSAGPRVLTYWDGTGPRPEGGYEVVGSSIQLFGTAIIGREERDDAQDYYTFQYVGDGATDGRYAHPIPGFSNDYNIRGETEGPVAIRVDVGNRTVPREAYLATRPAPGEQPDGMYVDLETNVVELYGVYRPAFHETVTASYVTDQDADPNVHHFTIPRHLPTYNLEDPDLSVERPIRVFVGSREVPYDATKTNGYVYDPNTGDVRLYGEYRPNLLDGEDAVALFTPQAKEQSFYEIPLNRRPELYHLGDPDHPSSIQVTTDRGRMIPYDATKTDGFFYNETTNRIELYGTARPNVKSRDEYGTKPLGPIDHRTHETYTIHLISSAVDRFPKDDRLEVSFSTTRAEWYSLDAEGFDRSVNVIVGGTIVPYDETKTNGYVYNPVTNRIELYGDARPDAGRDTSIRYTYVQESSQASILNGTYDFQLPAATPLYGVTEGAVPRSVRVFGPTGEIPYDAANGFTVHETTRQIALHGEARPTGADEEGAYTVVALRESMMTESVPVGSFIHDVTWNGESVPRATSDDPNGYVVREGRVQLIGSFVPHAPAPPAHQTMRGLRVEYVKPEPIVLDRNAQNGAGSYCEHTVGSALPEVTIVPESIAVTVDGVLIPDEAYTFDGKAVHLRYDDLALTRPYTDVHVAYDASQGLSFEDRTFIFQVGAQTNDHIRVDLVSFDRLLADVSPICVLTYDDANEALRRCDGALQFTTRALGQVGALTNRLDHTEQNVRVTAESMASTLSRIEDADLANEQMRHVRATILQESTRAMLAQANANESRVLELLR